MISDRLVIEGLAEQVAAHFGLTLQAIEGSRSSPVFALAPPGCHVSRPEVDDLSLAQIGACFGGYDHSTVLHACRKVEERLKADVGLPNELAELAARCH